MEDREPTLSAMPALDALVKCGKKLARLSDPHSTITQKVEAFRRFVDAFGRPLPTLGDVERHERARGAFLSLLERLSDAARQVGDPPTTFHLFREKLHRAIESHTFGLRAGAGGVQIVESRSVGFGSFDLVIAVGLNEGEWPARTERNIFYPHWLLKDFGWPTDSEALAVERAGFTELLRLPTRSVAVFRHLLEDEIPTVPSPFLEEIDAATKRTPEETDPRVVAQWIVSRAEALRAQAIPAGDRFQQKRHPGIITENLFDPEPISATAFELYLRCPFKHYVRYVLGIEEEEDFDAGLTPMERGRLIHDILQIGFQQWDARESGPRSVTPENYDEALTVFKKVALERLPFEHRHIEMARLFGGPGITGSIEWLLRLEMGRGSLRKRLLEFGFKNPYRFEKGPNGESPWWIQVKGRADRVDIESGGYLRVFDYKSGKAPESKLTLQIPLYALCLSQELGSKPVEAAYLSLRDKKVVARQDYQAAVDRLSVIYRNVREGTFPPRPYQAQLCNACGYAGLCRKEFEESGSGPSAKETRDS
jgi:CRISPR/Cas system-associated exonuclease Cas4 (RecB family)